MFNVLMILCIVLYVLLAVGLIALSIRFNKIIFVIAFVILEFLVLALNRGTLYSQGGSGMLYPIIFLCYIVIATVFAVWTALAVKQYKIKALIPVAVFALTIIIQIAVFNYSTYGWFYSYKTGFMKQYPEVYKMDVEEKIPAIQFGCHMKSVKNGEQDAILNTLRSYILSPEGEKRVNPSYCKLNDNSMYNMIIVAFDTNGDNKYDVQYESDLRNGTWLDWSEIDY